MKNRWKYAIAASAFASLIFLGHPGDAWAEENDAAVQQTVGTQDDAAVPENTVQTGSEAQPTQTGESAELTAGEETGQQGAEADETSETTTETDQKDAQTADDVKPADDAQTADDVKPADDAQTADDVQPAADETKPAEVQNEQEAAAPVKAAPAKTESAAKTGFTKTVESGTYVIASALNGFKMLDVTGASTKDEANVELYEANGTGAQKFVVTWNDDGYYTIMNKKSGKYLDAASAGTANGTNVQQYTGNGTDAQKWFIVRGEDGFFQILSKLSQRAIDIKWGDQANGTNVWLYDRNGTKAQQFKFLTAADCVELANGVYEIASDLNQKEVLNINNAAMYSGANLQLADYNSSDAQKFILTGTGGGTYRLTSLSSGQTIDLTGGNSKPTTNIMQYSNNDRSSQRWYIRDTGDGTFYIVPVAAAANTMEIAGGSAVNGANIWSNTQTGSDAQKFYFNRVAYTPLTGEYTIAASGDNSKVLDIKYASRQQNANLQMYSANGTLAQKFIIKDCGDGFVTIANANSGHVLDVIYGSKDNRANVRQYADNGTMAQKWIVHVNDDKTVTFINANSSKVLDIRFGALNNGANVWQYDWNDSSAQKFVLTRTSGKNNAAIDYSYENIADDADRRIADQSSDTDYAIVVNCNTHQLSLYEGGQGCWNRIARWACGDGYYTATPRGSFRIYGKTLHFGEEHGYSCWYTSMFYGSFYLHSVTCYPYTFTPDSANQTGRAVSHGCVRMDINNAKWIYDNCPIGTRVYVFR